MTADEVLSFSQLPQVSHGSLLRLQPTLPIWCLVVDAVDPVLLRLRQGIEVDSIIVSKVKLSKLFAEEVGPVGESQRQIEGILGSG